MKSGIYNMDCQIAMKEFPDNFFELAIVDPPYGIGVNQMNMGGRNTIRPDNRQWDKQPPTETYFKALKRVSKQQIVWGGNYFPYLWESGCRGFLVWDKGNAMYGRDFAECEMAWTSFDMPADMIKISPNQLDRIHPTQKPIKLYEWLLINYAECKWCKGTGRIQPKDRRHDLHDFSVSCECYGKKAKILDTHLGSGSSAIAAHRLGFEFWGFELDKDYYEAAMKRIEQEKRVLTMF